MTRNNHGTPAPDWTDTDRVYCVDGHPVRHPCAAVVRQDRESIEAEVIHDPDHVRGHDSLRVVRVIGTRSRFGRPTIAPEVGRYDGEVLRQTRGDLVPHHVRLRITVKQEKWRSTAPLNAEDVHIIDQNRERVKLLEHQSRQGSV